LVRLKQYLIQEALRLGKHWNQHGQKKKKIVRRLGNSRPDPAFGTPAGRETEAMNRSADVLKHAESRWSHHAGKTLRQGSPCPRPAAKWDREDSKFAKKDVSAGIEGQMLY